ncbi:hypothetical protein RHMOL_Rhmol13G0278900 [Rhododendron molle]|uniref:Uncharacterized protein n=1 Tax=Rhododendron molle TaxID=49168 RepID=A0ACC0LCE3_RHOML|nr:hypothetical protein RHMOL_Rhmol13G0278900 [Rhododendron molle]
MKAGFSVGDLVAVDGNGELWACNPVFWRDVGGGRWCWDLGCSLVRVVLVPVVLVVKEGKDLVLLRTIGRDKIVF